MDTSGSKSDRYLSFSEAKAFASEKDKYLSDFEPDVSITEKDDGVYLHITVPREMFSLPTCCITTKILGMTHMSEEFFETPQGEEIAINYDLLNETRPENPLPGPLQNLPIGTSEKLIWRR